MPFLLEQNSFTDFYLEIRNTNGSNRKPLRSKPVDLGGWTLPFPSWAGENHLALPGLPLLPLLALFLVDPGVSEPVR